jgi:hypothetical protein
MDFDALPVFDLSPASQGVETLKPETLVDVINRGFETLVRKFDGRDYPLRPHTDGLMRIPYAAAVHFQKHSTVPGTRDAGSGAEQSFIGIVRVSGTNQPIDPPEFCEPFNADQCEAFGQRIEAIARDADEPVQVVSVAAVTASGRDSCRSAVDRPSQARTRGQGQRRRSDGAAGGPERSAGRDRRRRSRDAGRLMDVYLHHVAPPKALRLPKSLELAQRYVSAFDPALRLRRSAENPFVFVLERRCRRRPAANTAMRDLSDVHIQARDGYIHVASVHPALLFRPHVIVEELRDNGRDTWNEGGFDKVFDEFVYELDHMKETRRRRRTSLFRGLALEHFDLLNRLTEGRTRRISNAALWGNPGGRIGETRDAVRRHSKSRRQDRQLHGQRRSRPQRDALHDAWRHGRNHVHAPDAHRRAKAGTSTSFTTSLTKT